MTIPRSILCAVLRSTLGLALAGCGAGTGPPSFLLFVFDTTREDAVSVYGDVQGTTPTVDRLAAEGLRYTHAYAQAPWTLPSHATMFTGLLPSQHGVRWRSPRGNDAWVTLAERLRDAGYETVGVSENGWVSEAFNMTQGFERFVNVPTKDAPDVGSVLTRWLRERTRQRPVFVFVNVTDPHMPYAVRGNEPFLPPQVSREEALAVPQDTSLYFCSKAPHARELAILHGLYHGDVRTADAKLEAVLALLRQGGLTDDLVTIVASDHGEHFGEHRLVNHIFSVRSELLHVPLIVHGLAGVPAAVVGVPVALTDIMPTVLAAAGLAFEGHPLPTSPGDEGPARSIVAEHMDFAREGPTPGTPVQGVSPQKVDSMRRQCGADDRVFGGMRMILRYPMKLNWYTVYPPELYDIEADPGETNDLASSRPALVAELEAELNRTLARGAEAATPGAPAIPSPEILDRLRALGYVSGEPPTSPTDSSAERTRDEPVP